MRNKASETERKGQADPRPAQTRELVLQAARMIATADGQAAVTPTRLVEVSGVARSTIYRHWPDAAAIVVDAVAEDTRKDSQLVGTGDPGTDLCTYLEQLRELLESPGAAIIVAQAEIAERDERAEATLAGNGTHRCELVRDLLDDPRSDFMATHLQIVGPLFMQRFFTRQPIGDDLIDAVVDSYLRGRPQ